MINNLELGTVEKERKKLSAGTVEVIRYEVTNVGQRKDKVKFICKHPEIDKEIEISEVKHEKQGKLEIEGTWVSLDIEGKISKYSALAALMRHYKVKKLDEIKVLQTVTKKVQTKDGEREYLVIKAYE